MTSKHLMKIVVALLASTFCANVVFAQAFQPHWLVNPSHKFAKLLYFENWKDTTGIQLKKGSLGLCEMLVCLPQGCDGFSVVLPHMTSHCASMQVVAEGLSQREVVVTRDTVNLRVNCGWRTDTLKFQAHGNRLFRLAAKAVSERNDSGTMCIVQDTILPSSDDSYFRPVLRANWQEAAVPLGRFAGTTEAGRKILALGETCWGTGTFPSIGLDIVKDRIMNNNCRLVLLDLPVEVSIYANRYVHGDKSFSPDFLIQYFGKSLKDEWLFSGFLEWLRKYNMTASEDVSVLGVDFEDGGMTRKCNMFMLMDALGAGRADTAYMKLCVDAYNNDPADSLWTSLKVFERLSADSTLKAGLTDMEHDLLMRYLEVANSWDRDLFAKTVRIDSIKALLSLPMIDEVLGQGGTVTTYDHFMYSDYTYSFMEYGNCRSWGSRLKEKYADDYSCVALLASEGSALALPLDNKPAYIKNLMPAPKGSLEHLLHAAHADSLYIPVKAFEESGLCLLRSGIGADCERMRPCYPAAEMDGVIFVDRMGASVGNGMALSQTVWDKIVGYMWETQKKVNVYMDKIHYY